MEFIKNYQLALTPLSPIHIGCGEDFEPTNYVIDEGVLYGFDPSRVLISEQQRNQLEAVVNRASLLGIQRFFREHKQTFIPHAQVMMPVASGVASQYENRIGKIAQRESDRDVINNLSIERSSYTGRNQDPYIPGSSFKGCLRTGLVDTLNQGQRPQAEDDLRRGSSKLEKRLLKGDFATSPLRLLKVADLMPAGDVARQVLYATNRKKDLVIDKQTGQERQPGGITTRKECIAHGQYRILQGSITLQDLQGKTTRKNETPAPELQPDDLRAIAIASNRYHLPRLQSELRVLEHRRFVKPEWALFTRQLLTELKPKLDQGDIMLVRLGRYGTAECKTLSDVAQIKIMQGKGQTPLYQPTTRTVWLAASDQNARDNMLPFGWALVEINPKSDLPQLKAWCEQQTQQRPDMATIRQQHQATRQAAEAAKIAARKQAEEQAEQAAAQAKAEAEAAAQKAAELAAMSPNQRTINDLSDELERSPKQKQPGGALMEKIIAAYQQALAEWPTNDQQALAAKLTIKAIEAKMPLGKKEKDIKALLRQLRGES